MAIEFTVEHDHTSIGDDGEEQLIGDISFTVQTRPGDFQLRIQSGSTPRTINLPRRTAYLGPDGHLYKDSTSGEPFRLPANDPIYNLEHITYRADFTLTTLIGEPVTVRHCYFPAPSTDTTLYLTKVMTDPEQVVMVVRTKGYAEDILDASSTGVIVLTGTAAEARSAIGVNLVNLDDVIWYANLAAFPVSGATDVVYGARDTGKLYLWTGSSYVAARASVTASDITDSGAAGRAVVVAADAAAARAAIGAQAKLTAARGPLIGALAHLNHNQSTILQALADSTGVGGQNSDTLHGWFGRLGLALGTFYDANVWHCAWNDTNQAYDAPTVMHTSTAGARSTTYGGQYTAPSITGDMEVIACLAPTSWAPTFQSIVTKYGSATTAGFGFFLTSSGLNFITSSDGTTAAQRVFGNGTAIPFTAGQKGWVRATFRLNNGSGQSAVTFYTSTDGITWTQLGSVATNGGTTATFDNSSTPYELGSGWNRTVWQLSGPIYWIQVRKALANGADAVPRLPEQWDVTATTAPLVAGGPLILLMSGSYGGQSLPYFDDGTRLPKLLTAIRPDAVFIADGINDYGGGSTPAAFAAAYLTFITDIKTNRPNVPIIATTQNPLTSPYNASAIAAFARFTAAMATAVAAQAGVTVLDTWQAYGATPASLIGTDGTHPLPTGYQAQSDWMMQTLAAPAV